MTEQQTCASCGRPLRGYDHTNCAVADALVGLAGSHEHVVGESRRRRARRMLVRGALRRLKAGGPSCLALLLAALSLLASAATASAECAWVLWEEQSRLRFPGKESDPPMSGSTSWKLVQASPVEAECRRALMVEVSSRSRPSPNREIMADDSGVHETLFLIAEGQRKLVSMTTFRYICVPDTTDPRGPKEK